ncbi:uncharacterized protein LOC117414583 [Acipenser ruthenus]|uniref:uncharacterized protein LOC117414583 n=1 Tax=Acipenser ruthenus TaxID=7906 RepID=UPI0027406CB6|nr:uncharacterized protein LOC117414583 [Acipenser ruthenus]
MGYIIGCGYNGYVTGATYGNFSRDGQDPTAKASSLVHAEANALLLRSQKDLDKAVLYSSKKPCVSCKLLIEATGITEVIFIDDPKEKKQDRVYEINLWKPSADAQVTTGSSTPATSSSTPDSSSSTPASSSSTQASSSSTPATRSNNDDPSIRLKKKGDLMLLLALHMEESPKCEAPPNKMEQSVKYNKCGIVVTTGDKMKRIVTMDCSRNELHAVEVVMMNFPRSLKGGNVFLSRKPCYRCTQFIIQGEFSSVYYWPRDPERSCMTSDSSAFTDSECVDQMFLRSKISFECLVPETDMVKDELIKFTRKAKCECCHAKNYENDLSNDQMKNIMMADNPERVEKLIERALCCLDSLLPCSKGSFLPALEQEDIKLAIHALQLCYLLAARSGKLSFNLYPYYYHSKIMLETKYVK